MKNTEQENIRLWMHNELDWYRPYQEVLSDLVLFKINIIQATESLKEQFPNKTPDGVDITRYDLCMILHEEMTEAREELLQVKY